MFLHSFFCKYMAEIFLMKELVWMPAFSIALGTCGGAYRDVITPLTPIHPRYLLRCHHARIIGVSANQQ
jgi:hypothetical protein